MTDQGNGGIVPPAPAAPPPLAAAPPPIQPAPRPAPAPPPVRSGAGLWPLFTFLAFAIGVGGTLLTLWLTGELWNSKSSSYASSGSGSGSSNATGPGPAMPAPAPPSPAPPTSSSTPPTPSTLTGTWGTQCSGSGGDIIIFYDDGTAASDGENGTWQIDGNYVTLNNGSENLVLYWEMLGDGRARVRRSGTSESRVLSRCS